MNRDVGIRNGRLFQIFIHAAASTDEAALELDRYPRPALQLIVMMRGLGWRSGIVRHPLDTMIGDVLLALLARRNIFAVTLTVDNFWLIAPGVDLNLKVVRRLSRRGHRNDLHRLARGEHAVHAGGADADALLAAAHPQPVEFRTVWKFSENQRDLFLHNSRN